MKKNNSYAISGLNALKRAAAKVAADARKNNYKIPIWEDNKVKYIMPEIPKRTIVPQRDIKQMSES